MDTEEAKQLLIRYNAGECTDAEKALVENSFMKYNEHNIDISDERIEEIGREVGAKLPIHKGNRISIYGWSSVAAAVLISILAIVHWKLEHNLDLLNKTKIVKDVAPVANRATLKFANGKTIELNGTKEGLLVNGNSLEYLDGSTIKNGLTEQMLLTLSTSKGGEYQVILEDGTKVWLNALSSITYPSSFVGVKERRVSITGEAYFEVARNKSKPFIVTSQEQETKVLGTHFNINDYRDNGATVTTLLEGAVSITEKGESKQTKVLKPMQQLIASGKGMTVGTADAELTMAWKKGLLEFKDANIRTIMAEVARWYDLHIEYRGEVPDRVFSGSISRRSNLSVLLNILSYSDIKFRIEVNAAQVKKLIVEP